MSGNGAVIARGPVEEAAGARVAYGRTGAAGGESGWSVGRALLLGGLAVAILDGLDAVVFYGLRGASPGRVFQSVAAGLLGRQTAVAGGTTTALFGVALHTLIGFAVFAAYFGVSRLWPLLTRRPLVCGFSYGIGVYIFMNQVVVPLSAIGAGRFPSLPVLLNGLIGHALLVGLPCALVARRARPPRV